MSNGQVLTADQSNQILDEHARRLLHLSMMRARYGIDTPPHVQNELEDIEKEIGDLREQIRIAEEADSEVDLATKQAVQQVAARASNLHVSFINREKELEKLVESIEKPFMLLDAPAAYGKSYLLDEVAAQLGRRQWTVLKLDLKSDWENNRRSLLERLHDTLNHITSQTKPLDPSDKIAEAEIVSRLASYAKLALLFDQVETLSSQENVDWLKQSIIFPTYEIQQNRPGTSFLCVVAGRYITRLWLEPERGWSLEPGFDQRIGLSPFSHKSIMESLEKRIERQQELDGPDIASFSADEIRTLATNLRRASGGHPAALAMLLVEVNNKYSYRPPNIYFEDRATLYAKHTKKVSDHSRANLPENVRQIFPPLCLFRCYTIRLVEEVLAWWKAANGQTGHAAEAREARVDEARRLIENMRDVGLVEFKDHKHADTDNVIRRIVAMDQWLGDRRQEALALNKIAIRLFDAWLEEMPSSENHVWYRAMIIEHFFHQATQLAQEDVNSDVANEILSRTLNTDLRRYKQRFPRLTLEGTWKPNCERIFAELWQDEDIRFEAEDTVGQQGYSQLLHQASKKWC